MGSFFYYTLVSFFFEISDEINWPDRTAMDTQTKIAKEPLDIGSDCIFSD